MILIKHNNKSLVPSSNTKCSHSVSFYSEIWFIWLFTIFSTPLIHLSCSYKHILFTATNTWGRNIKDYNWTLESNVNRIWICHALWKLFGDQIRILWFSTLHQALQLWKATLWAKNPCMQISPPMEGAGLPTDYFWWLYIVVSKYFIFTPAKPQGRLYYCWQTTH